MQLGRYKEFAWGKTPNWVMSPIQDGRSPSEHPNGMATLKCILTIFCRSRRKDESNKISKRRTAPSKPRRMHRQEKESILFCCRYLSFLIFTILIWNCKITTKNETNLLSLSRREINYLKILTFYNVNKIINSLQWVS